MSTFCQNNLTDRHYIARTWRLLVINHSSQHILWNKQYHMQLTKRPIQCDLVPTIYFVNAEIDPWLDNLGRSTKCHVSNSPRDPNNIDAATFPPFFVIVEERKILLQANDYLPVVILLYFVCTQVAYTKSSKYHSHPLCISGSNVRGGALRFRNCGFHH